MRKYPEQIYLNKIGYVTVLNGEIESKINLDSFYGTVEEFKNKLDELVQDLRNPMLSIEIGYEYGEAVITGWRTWTPQEEEVYKNYKDSLAKDKAKLKADKLDYELKQYERLKKKFE